MLNYLNNLIRLFVSRQKTIGIILLFLAQSLVVSAQQPSGEDVNNLSCKSARSLIQQNKYKEAALLMKNCVQTDSAESSEWRLGNLLLGAETEFYLENDEEAGRYAALADDYYSSFSAEKQKELWLFGVRTKKISAELATEAVEYSVASKLYKEGLQILSFTGESAQKVVPTPRQLKADLLSGTAFIELKTGLFSEATTNLEKALAELGDSTEDDYSRAGILNDFGHLLNEQRSHRQAVNYLEKAAQIWGKQKDWRNFATAQQNLAVAFRGTGDFKKAQLHFEQVKDIAGKNNFGDLETMSLQGLASLYQARGEHRQAVEVLQKALSQTAASIRRSEILWRLSLSQNQMGEKASARANATECFEWATAQKIENLRYLCATNLGEIFSQDSPAAAEKWFQTAVEVTEGLSRRVAGREPEKVYFMQDKSAAYHKLIKLLVQMNKPEQALAVSEKLKSRVLREKLQSQTSKILGNEVSSRTLNLPADAVVVSYVLTDEECFSFVLKANEPPKILVLPIGEAKMQEQIKHYRESILSFSPTFKTEAKQLYDLLLKAANGEINDAKRLIIVPDGALWELPFQALINAASGKFLIEEREISYAPSLGILSELKSPAVSKTSQKNFVAFANSNRKDAAPLPESEREVAGIGELYAPSNIFVKGAATEKRVKTEAAQAKVLHLAVHGEINQTNPFDSALLFTPEAGDDGRLTVSEILQMNLPDSLVVLSSCDTSNGQVINGEGLLSLSWAFLASGGRSVVAAQWSVEEKATADLMLKFHRALSSNQKETANALRSAQLEALKRPAPLNHPFYWAAFVVVEDSLFEPTSH